jgi:phthiodiolone/phenolphthiodiolone dimycocerosates ketoreductase
VEIEIGVPGQIMPPALQGVRFAQRAEAAGFDSAWWPCHLMGWHPDSVWTEDVTPLARLQDNPHMYFDPLVRMGASASHTTKLKVGVVVTDLIRRHPAMAAQAMLTVDHLAQGRAIFGLGSGERMNLTPYGFPFDKPVARLEEGIDIVRRLWAADGPIDYDGRFHTLRSAVLGLRPYAATPPLWIAAHGPRMLELTGRAGDGWLPTKLAPDVYRSSLDTIRDSARATGRDPDHFTPGLLAYVLVSPDEQTLRRLQDAPLVRALMVMLPPAIFRSLGLEPPAAGFHEFVPAAVSRHRAEEIIDAIPSKVVDYYCFCGTPEQIAEEIATYHRAGLRHLIMWNITPFGDPDLAGYSFRALEEIKGIVRSHG